jgi:hypothetical protein
MLVDRRLKTSLVMAKGLAVITMIVSHSMLAMASVYQRAFDDEMGAIAFIVASYTLSLPILAGLVYRIESDDDTLNGRIVSVHWRQLLTIGCVLFCANGLRTFGSFFKLSMFFYWDVLCTVALSFLLLTTLAQFSRVWLVLVALGAVVAAPLAKVFLTPLMAVRLGPHAPLWLALLYGTLICALILFPVWSDGRMPRKFLVGLGVVLLPLCVWRLHVELATSTLLQRGLANLPLSLWSHVPHWPFLYWFPSVAFGYLFGDFILRYRSEVVMRNMHIVAVVLVLLCWGEGVRDFSSKLDVITKHSAKIYQVSAPTLALICSFFMVHFLAVWKVAPLVRLRAKGVMAVFSFAILPIYVFHMVMVYWGAQLLHALGVGQREGLLLLMVLTALASYGVGVYFQRAVPARQGWA